MQKIVDLPRRDGLGARRAGQSLEIEEADPTSPEGRLLLAALDVYLSTRYAPEQSLGERPDQLKAAGARFFVARLNGQPAGCGALQIEDGAAEIKRMYTAEAARGKGVARQVIAVMEDAARRAGVRSLRLETGRWQPDALSFYEHAGYVQRGPFGRYLALPPAAIRESLFYEKRL